MDFDKARSTTKDDRQRTADRWAERRPRMAWGC